MTLQNTDKFLVNRSGSSYHVEFQNIMSTIQDTDLLLVNRGGKSYKVTWGEIKNELGPSGTPPSIESIFVNEVDPTGDRFTDKDFVATVTMSEEGDPVSVKTFVSYVEGKFTKKLQTDEITDWNDSTQTLTFRSDKDLAAFQEFDVIRQNETILDQGWAFFDADGSNTYNGGNNSALAQDDTQTYIVAGRGSVPLKTWVQRGPVTNLGPWAEVEIDNFVGRVARIADDILYIVGQTYTGSAYPPAIAVSEDGGKTFKLNTIFIDGNVAVNPDDFVKWQGKYWLVAQQGLFCADAIVGPYYRVTEIETPSQPV